jgi:hypothetical protein
MIQKIEEHILSQKLSYLSTKDKDDPVKENFASSDKSYH